MSVINFLKKKNQKKCDPCLTGQKFSYKQKTNKKQQTNKMSQDNVACHICDQGTHEEVLLLCDGPCNRAFHTFCINLDKVPKTDSWYCGRCVSRDPNINKQVDKQVVNLVRLNAKRSGGLAIYINEKCRGGNGGKGISKNVAIYEWKCLSDKQRNVYEQEYEKNVSDAQKAVAKVASLKVSPPKVYVEKVSPLRVEKVSPRHVEKVSPPRVEKQRNVPKKVAEAVKAVETEEVTPPTEKEKAIAKAIAKAVNKNRSVHIYVRVSTKGQNQPEYGRVGQITQEKAIRDFCKKHGLTIVSMTTEVGSAYRNNTPMLDKLIKKVKKE